VAEYLAEAKGESEEAWARVFGVLFASLDFRHVE